MKVNSYQLRKIISEEILNELLVQKLNSLSVSALGTLVINYTQYKEYTPLIANLTDVKKQKERLIYIINSNITDENRIKLEKEMPAWRWGWTRSPNRKKSDDALAGIKTTNKKKDGDKDEDK
jgi:hypothetical protein